MDLRKTYITRLLSAIALLLACILFSACFDIPSEPSTKNAIDRVSIQIEQNGKTDSTLLKIHPQDSAVVSAMVHPDKFKKNLSFAWYHTTNNKDQVLIGEAPSITIPSKSSENHIPDYLVVTDKEGNSTTVKFEIIVNTPPEFNGETTPANGDTLYGNTTTSFQFKWHSLDKDNERLTHAIIIDSSRYEVGDLTSIYQSGFTEGKHTFQIVVFDAYGDSDSTSIISFYVENKEKK